MERCFVNSEAVLNQEDRHGNTTEGSILLNGILVVNFVGP